MTAANYVAIPGSERTIMKGARLVGPAPADERFEVTVRLRPRQPLPSLEQLSSKDYKGVTHAQFETEYGAIPDDVAKVEAFAKQHGLTVTEVSLPRRTLTLAGTVSQFSDAFGVKLDHYEHARGTYRGRTGPVRIPAALKDIVVGVFGLDNRPFAHPRLRRLPKNAPHAAAAATFDPPQVAQLYGFPNDVDGTGQCIGIIELGGGFRGSDVKAFFARLNLKPPAVVVVPVDGGANNFADQEADGEVALDIQVAGGVAPGARIAVYFTNNDNSGQGFIDSVSRAIHDAHNNPSVLSISWGGPDENPTDNFLTQFNEVLQEAATLQVTVCAAAGDNGAADETPHDREGGPLWDGQVHVDFPASSPFVLACGGTRLVGASGRIESETVWNQGRATFDDSTGPAGSFGATGGGVSTAFPLPDYQKHAHVPTSLASGKTGRGVPDVAGPADPQTGYNIVLGGQPLQGMGGTSAVAPLWAGLIALINQKTGRRVGFINPKLYAAAGSPAFHDIAKGSNRVTFSGKHNVGYDAHKGWDPCTGLGSPNGSELAKIL